MRSVGFDAAKPTAQHFTDFVKMFRKVCVGFYLHSFYFPEKLEEKFERIELYVCASQCLQFLFFLRILRKKERFKRFYKTCINFFSKSIPQRFRNMRHVLMPQFVTSNQMLCNIQTSDGGGGFRGKVFRHTFRELISVDNLLIAWQEFLRGKRNKPDVQAFSLHLMDNILALHDDLQNGTYRHGPYHAFSISDPKPRRIHKACVRDRVLHHALYRALYPYFDRTFIADAYSCRVGKGTHKAINRFRAFAYRVSQNHTRTTWVLKCDIRKFFEHINHDVLFRLLEERIVDFDILGLLYEVIYSFSAAPGRGLPLGNLTSQLFANNYLNEFDQWMKNILRERFYIRYGDDFVIFSRDRDYLLLHIPQIRTFLYERLRLILHPQKLFIKSIASGVDFLGWVHFSDHRVLRGATRRRMMRRIAKHGTPETMASYRGFLKHGNAEKLKRKLGIVRA